MIGRDVTIAALQTKLAAYRHYRRRSSREAPAVGPVAEPHIASLAGGDGGSPAMPIVAGINVTRCSATDDDTRPPSRMRATDSRDLPRNLQVIRRTLPVGAACALPPPTCRSATARPSASDN